MRKHDQSWRAFSEIGEWTWQRFEGEEGRAWYVPLVPNAADWVHVDDPQRSGYRGSKVEFNLVDGSTDTVTGPWHATASELLEDTGFNITELNLSKVTLRIDGGKTIYSEVEHVLGSFSRGLRVAEQMANLYGVPVSLEVTSASGRQWKYVEPKGVG